MLAAASWAGAETFPLQYRATPEGQTMMPRAPLTAGSGKPEGIGAEPEYKAKPLYVRFAFGPEGEKKAFTLVVDKSSAKAKTYDLLYIDLDRDGDIREEKPLPAGQPVKFELPGTAGGKPLKRQFEVRVLSMGPDRCMVMVGETGTWTGKMTLAGKQMDIMLMDGNVNGIYNEPLQVVKGQPAMGRPTDGFLSKPIKGMIPDFSAIHLCPAIIEAGGKLYDVTIAPDGSSISFELAKGPFGTVETAADGITLLLIAADGRSLSVTAKDRKLRAPVGDARLMAYAAKRTDAKGTEWLMLGGVRSKSKLTVEEGKAARFRGGPPVRLSVKCDRGKKVQAGTTVKLSPVITDAAGEDVQIIPIGQKSPRPSPAFVVVKQGEKVIARGKCEPG